MKCDNLSDPKWAGPDMEAAMETVMRLANEFRVTHGVTRTDANHMLHNQLNVAWGDAGRARQLCLDLREIVAKIDRAEELLELINFAEKTRGNGAVTLTAVLGYNELHRNNVSRDEYLIIRAVAGIVCALHDLFDVEAGIDRSVCI